MAKRGKYLKGSRLRRHGSGGKRGSARHKAGKTEEGPPPRAKTERQKNAPPKTDKRRKSITKGRARKTLHYGSSPGLLRTTNQCGLRAQSSPPTQIAAWARGRQKYRSIKLRRLRLTAQYFCIVIGGNFRIGQPLSLPSLRRILIPIIRPPPPAQKPRARQKYTIAGRLVYLPYSSKLA